MSSSASRSQFSRFDKRPLMLMLKLAIFIGSGTRERIDFSARLRVGTQSVLDAEGHPRAPSSTTRIFSSAEKCRRVARRMSLIASSAGSFSGPDFCLIFAPCGFDGPEILPGENLQLSQTP